MAEQMHRLSVVRSLVSKEGDHARAVHYVRTGYRPDQTVVHPSLGSIVTRELPSDGLEIPVRHFISHCPRAAICRFRRTHIITAFLSRANRMTRIGECSGAVDTVSDPDPLDQVVGWRFTPANGLYYWGSITAWVDGEWWWRAYMD
jgi:hypothetical protein